MQYTNVSLDRNSAYAYWVPELPTSGTTPHFGSAASTASSIIVKAGYFVANGNESTFKISTQGGFASGSSVWLNQTYIGSWTGIDIAENNVNVYELPNLITGKSYVFTVLIDNMGMDESGVVGQDEFK